MSKAKEYLSLLEREAEISTEIITLQHKVLDLAVERLNIRSKAAYLAKELKK